MLIRIFITSLIVFLYNVNCQVNKQREVIMNIAALKDEYLKLKGD